LMFRLRAEAVVGPTGLAYEIRRRIDLHRKKIALYREIEARDFTHGMDSRERRLQHLVLHPGIMQDSQSIDLLRQALDILSM
ncbi:PadR family transcriptional regulator, partial [Burkholderia pseudomallei]